MRYTLAQLRKMKFPYNEVNYFDFKSELDGFEDIISSNEAKVTETIANIGPDSYKVEMDISIDLYLECAVTLEKIPYSIRTKTCEYYTFDQETAQNGDYVYIEGQTLDTKDEVLSDILVEKPMKSVKDGVDFEDDIEEEETEEEYINPAFAGLKDLFKK